MALSFAKGMLVISLIFSFNQVSFSEMDLKLLQSPDCRFLPPPLDLPDSDRSLSPGSLLNSAHPYKSPFNESQFRLARCCFVVGTTGDRPASVCKTSLVSRFRTWGTGRIQATLDWTMPVIVRFGQNVFRVAAIAADPIRYRVETPVDAPKFRTRAQKISTPIEVSPQIRRIPSKTISPPKETMDAYWQYYGDCDRWGVVFNQFQPPAPNSSSLVKPGILECLGMHWFRAHGFQVEVNGLTPLVAPIRQFANSVTTLSSPIFSAWDDVEYWMALSSFAEVSSTFPAETVADEENLHQIK